MAFYSIFKSDGTLLTTVTDGTVNSTAASIKFIGRNIIDYGQDVAENRLHVLENFADTTPPSLPVTGQLWWDTNTDTLKIFNGSTFVLASQDIGLVKNFIEPTEIAVINSKHQLIVNDEYVIEAGGTLVIEANASLVILGVI